MDAVAVSAARGAGARQVTSRQILLVALCFGGFQAGMPLLGYLLGSTFGAYVQAWDHWIAFAVLGFLGARMVHGALRARSEDATAADANAGLGLRVLLVLSVATSLDAFAVGVTLPFLAFPLALTITTIGVVTAIASGTALVVGTRVGAALGARAEILGGVVLIGLGVQILVSHLEAS
jgi:putative Mn2+ efflux pump MntP